MSEPSHTGVYKVYARQFKTETLVSESTVEAVRSGFGEVGDFRPSDLADFVRLYSVRQLSPSTS